jgi:2,3-bisphosphoglycerate-dependent phosphoglycerate mutase
VHAWRRSYSIAPPGGESLQQTYERVVPYFKEELEPKLLGGKNLLLVAHGNSLRALAMYLEHIAPEQISEVNIATGVPRIYNFDTHFKLQKTFYVD